MPKGVILYDIIDSDSGMPEGYVNREYTYESILGRVCKMPFAVAKIYLSN